MQQPLMTKSGLLESKCEVHSLISVFLCNGSLMNPSHLPTSSRNNIAVAIARSYELFPQ